MSNDQLQILPVIDTEAIRVKANEFALKGAIKEVEEYYTGYNSPFRKAISEELAKQEIGGIIALPNVIAAINDGLAAQAALIVNQAIAQSFMPKVARLLTRVDKEIKFSDLLKEFIEVSGCYDPKIEDFEVSVEVSRHGWLEVDISTEDKNYKLTLHEDYQSKKAGVKKYHMLSLPVDSESRSKMKISLEGGGSLEMPFTSDVLSDGFISYLSRLVICDSLITMDTEEFQDWMFPERCHCD